MRYACSLIPAGFLAGAAICAAALRSAPDAIAVDRAQPLAVVTYWQTFGARMWLALLVSAAIASIGYLLALRKPPSLRAICAWSALSAGAALLFPVVFSSDVYAYAGYGDLALRGIDPYAHARVTMRDPILDAMVWQWGNPPPMCVYGPAFVAIAKAIVAFASPFGVAAVLWAFRALACASLIACAPLAYAAFAPFSPRMRCIAATGIALNPVAIWSAAEGHNDALALAVVLAGFALMQRSRLFAGAAIAGLSALLKAPGAIAAAGAALAAWPDRVRFKTIAAGAAAGIAAAALAAVPLEWGVRAHLAPDGQYAPQFSLQYALATLMPLQLAIAIAAIACAAIALYGIGDLARGRLGGALAIATAAWIAVPNPYPWYAVWIVPVAFLAWGSPLGWALIAASLTAVARLYGDATTDLPRAANLAIVLCEIGVPLAVFIAGRVSSRSGLPGIRKPAPDFAQSRSR